VFRTVVKELTKHLPAKDKALIWAMAAFIVMTCLWGFGVSQFKKYNHQVSIREAIFATDAYRKQIENRIDRRISRLQGIASFTESNLYLPPEKYAVEFKIFSQGLMAGKTGIRTIIVSPNSINQYIYPEKDKQTYYGKKLLQETNPQLLADIKAVIKNKNILFSGPYEYQQGKIGLVARKAIYKGNQFWGIASIEMDLFPILDEAGVNDQNKLLNLALRVKEGRVYYGDKKLFVKAPFIIPFVVTGRTWELAGAPIKGWDTPYNINTLSAHGFFLILTLFVTYLTYLLSLKQLSLKDILRQKTFEITEKDQRFFTQIIKEKQLEERLRLQESQYQELTESIDDVFFAMDPEFRYTYWNRASEKLTGVKARDALGKTIYDLFPGIDNGAIDNFYKSVLISGKSGYLVNPFKISEKEEYFEIHAYPTRHGISVFARNITDKIKSSQRLEHQTSFLDSDPSPILEIDENGEVIYCNKSAKSTLEWLMLGNDLRLYFPPNLPELLEWLKQGREGLIYDEINLGKVIFGASILLSPQSHSIRCYLADITTHKNNETRLKKNHRMMQVLSLVNEALIRADEEKSFLMEVCRILREKGGYGLAWIGQLDKGAEGKVLPVAYASDIEGIIEQLNIFLTDSERGGGPSGKALRTHKPVILSHIDEDTAMKPWQEIIKKYGGKLAASFPFQSGGDQWWVLSIYSREMDSFSGEEQVLMQQLVDDISYGLQSLRVRRDRDIKEEALYRRQEEIKAVIQSSPMAIIAVELGGNVIIWNKTAEEMLGWSADEMLGRKMAIIPPDKSDEYLQFRNMTFKGENIRNLETRWLRKNGNPVDISISLAPIYSSHREITGMMAVIDDITEDNRMKAELRESQILLDTAVRASNTGLWSWEFPSGKVSYSPEWGKILGYEENELIKTMGQWERMIHPDDHDRVVTYVENYLKENDYPYSIQYRMQHKNGNYRWVMSRASLLMDDEGKPQRLVGSHIDITEVKEKEEEIRLLNETLEERVKLRTSQLMEANKELESFSYSVSHDLRVPLRAIDGFSRIMMEEYGEKVNEEGKRLLQVIRDNSRKMGNLIDDLLAFSRLGRREINRVTVDMNELAKSVLEDLTVMMDKSRLEIQFEPMPSCNGDPSMLRQVYQNLLSNAIKFSSKKEKSHIEIGALTEDSQVVYYVKDNGAGFDMRYADKLFGVFQRLHSPEEFEGTGVGLALVHRIISRHGGKIWADSKPGEGAKFYFTIPLENENE
jgi:PAS domain S-box-containing protein